jgi:type I restriction enzyme S subunit
MNTEKLGNIIKLTKGKKHLETDDIKALRYLQIEDVNGSDNLKYTAEKGVLVNSDEIVLVWDGANAGKVGIGLKGVIGSTLSRLSIDTKIVYPKYLYWFLQSKFDFIKSQRNGATIPHVSSSSIKSLPISIFHLNEQQRIATILDHADSIRRKNKQILEKYNELAQSVFYEMFGDPDNDFKNWRKVQLDEVIIDGPQNGLYKPANSYGKGTPIIRIDSFNNNIVNVDNLKRVELDEKEISRFELRNGEFLINRVNSMSHLGKCGLVLNIHERTVFESNMMRVRFNPEKVSNFYVLYILSSKYIKNQIIKCSKDAVNQSSINQNDINSFTVPLPPIQLQRKFNIIIENIEFHKKLILRGLQKSEDLFQSLLQKAFKGEL